MNFDIRQSQAIHTWPTGAVIDFPQLSLIMLCHDDNRDDWGLAPSVNNDENIRTVIKDARLAEAFRVNSFIVPPAMDGIGTARIFGIRFPSANYCPKCGLIEIANKARGEERGRSGRSYDAAMSPYICRVCSPEGVGPTLVPMRFVIATEDGFLDDFPWDWYVHRFHPEEMGQGHRLFYTSKGGSASLADITITSKRRDNSKVAWTSLSDIFDQKIFAKTYGVAGNYLNYVNGRLSKPWKGWGPDGTYRKETVVIPTEGEIWQGEELTPKAKSRFPRTMQRGAGNIIFPIVYSSILIPESTYQSQCPEDVTSEMISNMQNFISHMPEEYEDYTTTQWRDYFLGKVNMKWGKQMQELGYTSKELINFIQRHFGEDTGARFGDRAEILRTQEYQAFTGDVYADPKIWFKKRRIAGDEYNQKLGIPLLESVVLMDKLSAIKVLKGFTRIKPLMTEELIFADHRDELSILQQGQLAMIQDARKYPDRTDQLPAIEVRGEGIFLRFNHELINSWCKNYPNSRLNTINANLEQANIDFHQRNEPLNKRYLFLHTLSHIILKELAEDCGYGLSSLAEIIYCSKDDKLGTDDEMNGILIYTTTSDAEGSLGGLVEKGNPSYLASIIQRAVEKAQWCSSDPLCISATGGQGFLGLNLAACYSCVLLPETSCEKMNKYLDRATLIGTLERKEFGLFSLVDTSQILKTEK
jgi:hypothetical protein